MLSMLKKKKVLITLALMAGVFVVATILLIISLTQPESPIFFAFPIPFMIIPVVVSLVIITRMSKPFIITVSCMAAIFSIATAMLIVVLRWFHILYNGETNWTVFLFVYVIPFMIVPTIVGAIITVIAIVSGIGKSFNYLTNRLVNIDTKLKTCSSAEREKLTKQKQKVEQELAKFWGCEYCQVMNHQTTLRCHGCGANRK